MQPLQIWETFGLLLLLCQEQIQILLQHYYNLPIILQDGGCKDSFITTMAKNL